MMTLLSRPIAAAAMLTLMQASSVSAQDVRLEFEPIADEFVNSCASCHGMDGKGGGFLTEIVEGMDPGDLTQLAKRNQSIFPFNEVFRVIDGRDQVGAHGGREMPIWGDRYMVARQCTGECGPDELKQLDARARARILELVYYIQSIQER